MWESFFCCAALRAFSWRAASATCGESCCVSCARAGRLKMDPYAHRYKTKHKPSGRLGARREWGVRLIKFYETALGDSRAEATSISGVIVPFKGGGRAIDLCERGIPQKYWSVRPVAGKAAKCCGVEAAGAVG